MSAHGVATSWFVSVYCVIIKRCAITGEREGATAEAARREDSGAEVKPRREIATRSGTS